MATIRKIEGKKGITYKIQVKIKDFSTQSTITKVMSWHPEEAMSKKNADAECQKIAEKFEKDMKKIYSSSQIDHPDYNITVADFSQIWLKRIKQDYSIRYYETSVPIVKWICRYIGGYKITEITPYIIQSFFDKLDQETYIVYTITAKPELKQVMEEKNIRYKDFRYTYKLNCASFSHLLNGQNVSMNYAKSIAKILGVKLEKIFNIEKEVHLYSKNSISKIKRTTRCIFSLAKRQRIVEENYATADYVSYGRKPKPNIKYLDDKQAKQLCIAVMKYKDIRMKACVMLLLLTGIRRGEAAGLEWKDVDFNNNLLSIKRTSNYSPKKGIYTKEPKTEGSIRTLTMSALLSTVLQEYKEWYDAYSRNWGDQWIPSDRLFVREKGAPINPDTIYFWFQKLLKEIDFPHVTVHSLRHTNITLQITSGVPLVTVSVRAGHSRTSTTADIYSHFIKTSDEVAAETLNNIFTIKDEDESCTSHD
jgi:integrase